MDELTKIYELFNLKPEYMREAADEVRKLHDVLCEIADCIETGDEEKKEQLIGKLAMIYYNILQK